MPRTPEELSERHSRIEGAYHRLLDWLPYATLALSAALSLLITERPLEFRLQTLGLALAAALWVYLVYTRMPSKTEGSGTRLAVHLFGMLAIGAALMHRDMLFFIFVVTGFFHAGYLKSMPALVAGIGASSIVVNSSIVDYADPDPEGVVVFVVVVVVQTLAISSGFLLNEKLVQLRTQREEALLSREAALQENAGLHMQLLTQAREAGILDERQRMARDIHDTVAQGLAGIIAQLHAADGTDDESQRRRHLDSAADLARESLAEARRTVQAIGPPTLDTAQLPEALAEVSAKWSQAHDVPVELVLTGDAKPMHPEVEVTLLRVTQEALQNAAKHSRAARVGITLSYMEDQLALDVRDDGVGFEPSKAKAAKGNGYGIAAMRQRVGRLAGSFSVESEPGSGTVVSAIVPAVPQAVADAA
ncbi:sensor histidine kinase [Glycomyces algeriensis]|uniref:sensor histidine kinase n=1 Tax=Glycomyces algeriensis TaxID=256037 RepID=UPI0028670361|nr:sensor histidine kinase [Glycomyces algeriensis]MDR7351834.1 signal transduction histidine kinase [Glycomyces algeriensis]